MFSGDQSRAVFTPYFVASALITQAVAGFTLKPEKAAKPADLMPVSEEEECRCKENVVKVDFKGLTCVNNNIFFR